MNAGHQLPWEDIPESERLALNILNRIQAEYGYIPQDIINELAGRLETTEAELHGLVSFFSSYRVVPAGKHKVRICCGAACYARGAPLINDRLAKELGLDGSDTSADGLVTVEQVYCVGACSQAPVIITDDEMMSRIKSFQVPALLANLREKP